MMYWPSTDKSKQSKWNVDDIGEYRNHGFDTFDFASGCIFNPTSIKKFYLLTKKHGQLKLDKLDLKQMKS